MFEKFRRDVNRYIALDYGGTQLLKDKLKLVLRTPQIHAIGVYRFGHWVKHEVSSRALRVPLLAMYYLLDRAVQTISRVEIHPDAVIGGGLYIGHVSDLLIGPVKMGDDCNIGPNVVIGLRNGGRVAPTIGDRVWIGAGSVLFGQIVVGSGASIGPLTVVGRNVGPKSLVAGNPMQIIRRDYDNTRDIYGTPRSKQQPSAADSVKSTR